MFLMATVSRVISKFYNVNDADYALNIGIEEHELFLFQFTYTIFISFNFFKFYKRVFKQILLIQFLKH